MKRHIRPDESDTRESGFTLVELVIAVSVLAVSILAVSAVLDSGVRALAAAKARARGNEIATEGIEDLQRFNFSNLGLCDAATGTPPAGLETPVELSNCAAPAFTHPCQTTAVAGTVPQAEYVCVRNGVSYTVKRYVAWVDALRTTKRLAVYVEWTDLVGNHQVSQQSSLRAPDQAAIVGLAPPTFVTQPTAGPSLLHFDANRNLNGSSQLQLEAQTSTLHAPATGGLSTEIAAHAPGARFDVKVSNWSVFPSYNGFPITITKLGTTESFTVLAGAGSEDWVIVAEGSSHFPAGSAVNFAGDQVYAQIRTLGPNNHPQTSTVFLTPNTPTGVNTVWRTTVTTTSPEAFRFGEGSQYVAFGILRAADGKTSGAFSADPAVTFCPETLGCSGLTQPSLSSPNAGAASVGASGELLADVPISVDTVNVSSSDAVTVSFLTQAGTVTVALQVKSGTTCPDSLTATAGVPCTWEGVIAKAEGYRINQGPQTLYFTAQQVFETANPASIDKGSTGATTKPVNFA